MANYRMIDYKKPNTVYQANPYNEKQGAYASQIANAQKLLNQHISNKPGAYQSLYQKDITGTIDQIKNRKPFVYDLNADALYKQYKDQYVNLGKQAAADTMGQISALTGGYGNSYAATASNQAYQNYLSQLNEVVPELYNNAYSRYQNEEAKLYNMLSMYQNQDALDYGKYQDAYANWQSDRNFHADQLTQLRGLNQDAWAQNESNSYNANNLAWNNYYNAENYNLDSYKQAVAEDQFNAQQALQYAQLAEEQRQFNKQMEENQRQFKLNQELERELAQKKNSDVDQEPFAYNPDLTFSDTGVSSFINSHPLYEDAYNAKKGSQISYRGADNFEEYLENELDSYKYKVNGKEYKLTDDQKMQILAHYDMNKNKDYSPYSMINSTLTQLNELFNW